MPNFDKIKIDGTPYLVHDTETATALSAETQARKQTDKSLQSQINSLKTGKIYYCSNNGVSTSGAGLQSLLNSVESGSVIIFDGYDAYTSQASYTISKPMTIMSTCPYLDLAFVISANYVSFKNVNFDCNNSQYPITVNTGRFLTVDGCRFTDCVCAIRSGVNNGVVSGKYNDSLWHSRGCWTITGCVFEGCQYGIMAEYSTSGSDPTPVNGRWMRNNDWTITDNIFNFCSVHSVFIRGLDGMVLQGNTFFAGKTSSGQYTESHVYIADNANYIIIEGNQFFESGSWSVRVNFCHQMKICNNNFAWPGSSSLAGAIIFVNPPVGGYNSYIAVEIVGNRFQGGSNHLVYLQYSRMGVNLTGNTFSYSIPPKLPSNVTPPDTIFAILSSAWNLHQAGNQFTGMTFRLYSTDNCQGEITNYVTTSTVTLTANKEAVAIPTPNPFAGHCTVVAYNTADEDPANGGNAIVHDLTISASSNRSRGTLVDHGQVAVAEAAVMKFTRIDNSGNLIVSCNTAGTYRFIFYWTGYHRIDFLRVYDTPVE